MDGRRRAIVAALFANLGIAVARFAGFLVTGAASLAAEAIHSFADNANQGPPFLRGVRARRAPDAVREAVPDVRVVHIEPESAVPGAGVPATSGR